MKYPISKKSFRKHFGKRIKIINWNQSSLWSSKISCRTKKSRSYRYWSCEI